MEMDSFYHQGKGLEKMLAMLFALLVSAAVAFGEQGILSQEEDLELNRQLKELNRPAVKSFRTEFGDIIDCVDIFKQSAFSHPLLKNHTIQMKPSTIPVGLTSDASKGERLLQRFVKIKKCPTGSVPIRRTKKEDLIAAKHLKPLRSHPSADNLRPDGINPKSHYFAVVNYRSKVSGAKSQINVWNPSARDDQFSLAGMWLTEGTREQENSVQAGWAVIPRLFQNNNSILYIFWTADGYRSTGCYNTLCPGFVQVSSEVIPGLGLRPISEYNGPQYDIPVSIHQDVITGNWLFMVGDKYVGYWPKGLLPSMSGGASFISWGGEVVSPKASSEPRPVMGSGRFPEEGFRKAAYVNQIQVAYDGSTTFIDPVGSRLEVAVDSRTRSCYDAILLFTAAGNWGHHIYFGGPGDCSF